jgi:hypothetical protein
VYCTPLPCPQVQARHYLYPQGYLLPTGALTLVTLLAAQEAADKRQLAAPVFKTLNMGLSFIGLAHVLTLAPWWTPCSSGPYMPYIIATWGLASAIGTWGFLSTTPAAMDDAF